MGRLPFDIFVQKQYRELGRNLPGGSAQASARRSALCGESDHSEGERDFGMIPNGDVEQDSGVRVNTASGMKPNSFRPIPEWVFGFAGMISTGS